MKRNVLVSALLAIGFFAASLQAQAVVTFDYNSKISVVGSAADNGNGTWTYSFNLTNTDTSNIWYVNFYTGSQNVFGLSDTLGLTQHYTQYTSGGTWNVPSAADQYFAGFYNNSWPGNAAFLVGQSGNISFTTNAFVGNNLQYAYWTQNNYGNEHFTALGNANVAAVPEAETYAMLLVGLGLMGFVARRKSA